MASSDSASTMPDPLNPTWRLPSARPVLGNGTVHLWRIPLHDRSKPMEGRFAHLSEDEQARATRFHFPKDQRRFVLAHAALRVILGFHIGQKPASVRFEVGRYGKPTLIGRHGLHFNLTHSGELAVVALSPDRELGVDIEQMRDMADLQSMAARFFTPTEQAALMGFSPADRVRAFLDGWTRKEAVMKALGLGVVQPPESIEVSLEPRSAVLRSLNGQATSDWTLTAFGPGPGYTGAVAMQSSSPDLLFYDWSDELFGGIL